MKPYFFLLCCSLLLSNLHAQFQDNFSDGNFSSNPTWTGNADRFLVNAAGELQLNDSMPVATNTTYLVTNAPTSLDDSTTWEFYVRLEFATSTTNFARVYLAANQADLSGNVTGYFLKIGGATGSTDAIELYRQDGVNTTLLLSGTASAVGGDPVIARLRVTRSTTGEWTLFADYQGGTNFKREGSVLDTAYYSSNYFGFYARYSSTRNKSFFWDDVVVNPLFSDETPPKLLEAKALSATQVEVTFDEPLAANVTNSTNFSIDKNIGNPTSVVLSEPAKVLLTLNNPLTSGVIYTLSANNISDQNGNTSATQTREFGFQNVQPTALGDLLISEIMADPSPAQGLPDAEFVELYNKSDKVIQLQNVGFSAGSTPQKLPAFLLQPKQYVIICDDANAAIFAPFGNVVAVGSFPALTNGGDDLTLTNANGQVIFAVNYTDDWYQNAEKAQGGWTLELIDLQKNATCAGNWRASVDPKGGTPGKQNSLFGMTSDTTSPQLLRGFAQSETEILLTFSEDLEITAAENLANYTISNNVTISDVFLQNANEILLTLGAPLQNGQLYTVTASGQITDCLGNGVKSQNSIQIGVAEAVQPGDLMLNEILFNPATGGSDFIELYNISNKILNINGLQILNATKTGSTASQTITTSFLLLPNTYVTISENPQELRTRYQPPTTTVLLENDLPTFDDDEGNVTIRANGITIDSFDYLDDYHFALLSDKEGVSLERISFTSPTQGSNNWQSAAASVLFATPGYQNSQFNPPTATTDQLISIANKRFSPDGDGYEDVLFIDYNADQSGLTANIHIFDANGRLVTKLVQNEGLAARGNFKWDGTTDEGSKARIGIYVVWIELFSLGGRVERRKETCVLAGKLD